MRHENKKGRVDMRAVAYEGYFNNGQFYASGKAVKIPEKRRVFITIFDETESVTAHETREQKESAQEWLDDFFRILSTATEDLDEKDFPRISFRKPEELFECEEDL